MKNLNRNNSTQHKKNVQNQSYIINKTVSRKVLRTTVQQNDDWTQTMCKNVNLGVYADWPGILKWALSEQHTISFSVVFVYSVGQRLIWAICIAATLSTFGSLHRCRMLPKNVCICWYIIKEIYICHVVLAV